MELAKWIVAAAVCAVSTFAGTANAQDTPKPHPGDHVHKLGSPSTTLTVTIDGKAKLFTLADLKALPQQDVTVFDKKANRNMVWSGPSVATVFAAAGMPFNHDTEHDVLHRYVVVTGSDGYMVVESAGELVEQFSGIANIVAVQRDGQPLGAIGQIALFNNGDKMPARHVSNLVLMDVRSAAY